MIMKSVLASVPIADSLAFAPCGQAGTHTWTGAAANGFWSTPSASHWMRIDTERIVEVIER